MPEKDGKKDFLLLILQKKVLRGPQQNSNVFILMGVLSGGLNLVQE